jgi:methyltransferase (TIGR00027 family)
MIAENMSKGIGFFNPSFTGTQDEALRWIVDNQLSPSPLGRAAWAEKALRTAVETGASQYVIVAAGYDTFTERQPSWAGSLKIFELDTPYMVVDKQTRIQRLNGKRPDNLTSIPIDLNTESLSDKLRACGAYDKSKLSFLSLLGIAYYLSRETFAALLREISNSTPLGSTVVFDYPDEYTYSDKAGARTKKQVMMAGGAGEAILADYSYKEMERLLSDCGFLIYEHLTPDEITEQYFAPYNKANSQYPRTAFDNVNYCLAVKK